MPSINLLPEDFSIDFYVKKERLAVLSLAVFFVVASVLAFAGAEFKKRSIEGDFNDITSEISNIDIKIAGEVNKNELLSSDFNESDINNLLAEHFYFSEGIDFLKDYIIEGVALSSAEFSYEKGVGFTINLTGEAKDYKTALDQIVILQDSYWAKEVNFSELGSGDEETGNVSLGGSVVLREELFTYHRQYWDLGIDIIAKEVNRFIEIETYSASLDSSNNNENVIVYFTGKCYKESELDEFEEKLNDNDTYVKELKITKNKVSSGSNSGVIKFNGRMVLKY